MPTETRRRPERRAVTARIVLAQFSTRLPPELLERLRVAALQLDLRQSDITAAALDAFLRLGASEHGRPRLLPRGRPPGTGRMA